MYHLYFSLNEPPFSIAPDPRYLYMSGKHQEALAHLLYGIQGNGGFVLLTGEVGTGKTTVCRCLLEQMPEDTEFAFIFNPKLTVAELLETVCHEFHIPVPPGTQSIKVLVDRLNDFLLEANAKGRRAVLIIDEAQNLSPEVLEQLRLLTNLETNERKLLQIILLGQPELQKLLETPELRQLAQRVIARYHLRPLTRREVAAYVQHRLNLAGTQKRLIPLSLMGRLHKLSGGVPRIINLLCDRALLGAYVQSKETVDRKTLEKAAQEVFGERPHKSHNRVKAIAALVLLGVSAALAYALSQRLPGRSDPAPTAESAQAAPAAAGPAAVAGPAVPETPAAAAAADVEGGDQQATDEAAGGLPPEGADAADVPAQPLAEESAEPQADDAADAPGTAANEAARAVDPETAGADSWQAAAGIEPDQAAAGVESDQPSAADLPSEPATLAAVPAAYEPQTPEVPALGPAIPAPQPPPREVSTQLRLPPASSPAAASADAYATLFAAWNQPFDPAIDPCTQAAAVGLRCLSGRGGLDDLRRLNLPAILKVSDEQFGVRDLALSRLGSAHATVVVGGQSLTISPGALAGRWNGDYTVLWDPPPDYVVGFQAGSRGPGVVWLRRQFAALANEAIPGDAPPVFDDDLAARVRAFQVAEGLVPDGVAGPMTLIRLAARSGQSTPKLIE